MPDRAKTPHPNKYQRFCICFQATSVNIPSQGWYAWLVHISSSFNTITLLFSFWGSLGWQQSDDHHIKLQSPWNSLQYLPTPSCRPQAYGLWSMTSCFHACNSRLSGSVWHLSLCLLPLGTLPGLQQAWLN